MKRALTLALLLTVVLAGVFGSAIIPSPFAPSSASAAQSCSGFADVTADNPACVAIVTLVP